MHKKRVQRDVITMFNKARNAINVTVTYIRYVTLIMSQLRAIHTQQLHI